MSLNKSVVEVHEEEIIELIKKNDEEKKKVLEEF